MEVVGKPPHLFRALYVCTGGGLVLMGGKWYSVLMKSAVAHRRKRKSSLRLRTRDPAIVAEELAETLLEDSLKDCTRKEAAKMKQLSRLIRHPQAKHLVFLMTDRLGRCKESSRAAKSWRGLLRKYAPGWGFSMVDRCLFRLGSVASRLLPQLVMEAIHRRLQGESQEVILPAEEKQLLEYLKDRTESGAQVNLNQLGEAVLGEEEAKKRLDALLQLLERDNAHYVSVKISAIFSQIQLVAWDDTLRAIKDRLRVLFRAAMKRGKFVNLDMEEYRDLHLTVHAFQELLSEEEFLHFAAGIALQAYLPDSPTVQKELIQWSRKRCAQGGVPIKIRLVKGANLAMEKVDAEMHGWNLASFATKRETDACFKQMLEVGCKPENAEVVLLGVGSHNLFDVALALVLRRQNEVERFVEVEMLEGMAPSQSRVVQEKAGGLLVYAPMVKPEDYHSALAYLVRRLDENTSTGNFLASLFSLKPGSETWLEQCEAFHDAWKTRHQITSLSHRATLPERDPTKFSNEPDTDWSQRQNRQRLNLAKCEISHPPKCDTDGIGKALNSAAAAQPHWEELGEQERARLLRQCADQLAETRFASIARIREEGKKAVAEADSEVSEAIDFARYYAEVGQVPEGIRASALGTVVVTPPWNFPFAIPCGGILAALMAGNAAILKPAPEAIGIGWWLVNQLWEAGIPREVLQYVNCGEGEAGRKLIQDPRTSGVILTGSFDTARRFQSWRPSLPLFAETSGKNAMVITDLSDRELAARDLVRSAFGHSGQKCSAASLGILVGEVYEDPAFLRHLRDATASLAVGPTSDLRSMVTPLVQPPGDPLQRALTSLEGGEEWLLQPKASPIDPCLWSPGIRMGVKSGSWFHQTECFGPVLGLMKARDLEEAIKLQNAGSFGLTAGIHSLDEDEIAYWKEHAEAGNLYINRPITGAIVQRQPFGGWKRSSVGPGAKAGGPNYVNLFRTLRDTVEDDPEITRDIYKECWESYFCCEHDPSGLGCESNIFRYRPAKGVLLRVDEQDERSEALACLAAQTTGIPLYISRRPKETDATLAKHLPALAGEVEFLRTTETLPDDPLLEAAAAADINWIHAPISTNGRIEFTRWTREQTISETKHRYGHLIHGAP